MQVIKISFAANTCLLNVINIGYSVVIRIWILVMLYAMVIKRKQHKNVIVSGKLQNYLQIHFS